MVHGPDLLVAIAIVSLIPSRRIIVRAVAMFVLFFGLALILLMIPRSQSVGNGVTVVSRGQTGSYETATLQSIDAGALLSWLEQNGFKVAPEVRAGIEEYVRDGWVFAAARLKPGGSGGRAHPLSFEFDTEAPPVYPMRLTGTQDRALSLRLFVLSDRRARCDALPAESCYETGPAEYPRGYGRDEDEVRLIGQPELLRIAGGATVLTTLRGKLEPAQMRSDLRLGFEGYAPVVPVFHSEVAARTGAVSTAAAVALALLLPCYLAVWTIREHGKGWRHACRAWVRVGRRGQIVAWCVAIGIGLVAGAADYVTTDVVERRAAANAAPRGPSSFCSSTDALAPRSRQRPQTASRRPAPWRRASGKASATCTTGFPCARRPRRATTDSRRATGRSRTSAMIPAALPGARTSGEPRGKRGTLCFGPPPRGKK